MYLYSYLFLCLCVYLYVCIHYMYIYKPLLQKTDVKTKALTHTFVAQCGPAMFLLGTGKGNRP